MYNERMEPKSNHYVVYSCKYYVVWCLKYRRRVLVRGVDEGLKHIIHQVAQEHDAGVIEMEVMPDHVQLLVAVDTQYGIHKLVKQLKGRSSRLLRQEFPWLMPSPAQFVDTFPFGFNGGRCAVCRHQAVHRKPKVGLNGGGPPHRPLSVKYPCGSFRRKKTPCRRVLRPHDSSTMPCFVDWRSYRFGLSRL